MTDIQPPDEIKTIVDKTSNFVARLGIDFEKRIYENEKENPKFGFLTPGDVYHNYYQQRLAYFRAELASAGTLIATQSAATSFQNSAEPPPAPPPSPPKEDIVKEETIAASEAPKHGPHSLAWRIWQIEKQVKQGELIPDPPIPFQFVQEIPNELTPLDLDIIRLTAQFVARNGQQFQMGLMNREIKNPQFEFLKPGNELHGYFLGLVESYTRCLLPSKGLLEKLKNEYLNEKQNIITKLILRYEFDKEQQRKQKELEEKEKEESIAASIDWHDYVIVETISFEDEQPNNNNNNYNKRMEVSTTEDISMDTEDMEMEIEEVKRPPSEMRIKKDYVKPTLQGMAMNSRKLQRCPKCGQDIPVEEMEEHMRIELLDPRYVQQRAQLIDKSRTASGASNEEITKNIGAFARRRTDIFGDDEEFEIGKTHDADAANKSNNNDDKVIWDGHTASIPAVTTKKINEQIAAIHASKGFQTTPSTSTSTSTTPDTIQQQQQINNNNNNNNNNVTSNTQITPPIPVTNRNIMPPQPPQPPLPTMTAPPPMPYEEPLSKRQKVIENDTPLDLVPEQQWLQRFPNKSISIAIQCPQDDKSEGKLTGQTITIKINMNDTVTTLKEKLKEQVAIPPNKQKLKGSGYHLKDDKTLAYYNFTDGTIVQLAKRERGGKR